MGGSCHLRPRYPTLLPDSETGVIWLAVHSWTNLPGQVHWIGMGLGQRCLVMWFCLEKAWASLLRIFQVVIAWQKHLFIAASGNEEQMEWCDLLDQGVTPSLGPDPLVARHCDVLKVSVIRPKPYLMLEYVCPVDRRQCQILPINHQSLTQHTSLMAIFWSGVDS